MQLRWRRRQSFQIRGIFSTMSHLSKHRQFRTTRWTLVVAAGGDVDSPESVRIANDALAQLCVLYWYPLYAFARRRGNDADSAADLTQGFFAHLLEGQLIAHADRTRGRFRHFLLRSFTNYLTNQHAMRSAARRGGDRTGFSIDSVDAEQRYSAELSDHESPERLFDRRWALSVLAETLSRLRNDYASEARVELFDRIKQFLNFEASPEGYEAIAKDLRMTAPAVKTAVYRLRRRYRESLRGVIGDSVSDPAEIDEEIRDLFAAVKRDDTK
jgi:RNA polymerase sigma-70 factor (ECF subfamily)